MTTIFQTGLPEKDVLTLQQCGQCGWVNYPKRELCGQCLADDLRWQSVRNTGVVQSQVALHYSLEPVYSEHLPWTVASIKLDCGPVVLAHMPPGIETGSPIKLSIIHDAAGNRMLLAMEENSGENKATSDWLSTVQFKEVSA